MKYNIVYFLVPMLTGYNGFATEHCCECTVFRVLLPGMSECSSGSAPALPLLPGHYTTFPGLGSVQFTPGINSCTVLYCTCSSQGESELLVSLYSTLSQTREPTSRRVACKHRGKVFLKALQGEVSSLNTKWIG